MRIVVTGGSGFIGARLVQKLLARGDVVTAFTRGEPGAQAQRANLRWVTWDPNAEGAWQAELARQDAVVHLAGATAVGRRYTDAVRREILSSRVRSTELVVQGLERAGQGTESDRPSVLVSASGVGYYGPHDDATELTESAAAGRDFLAEVCVAWEASARIAERHGVRAVQARIGFVLGRGGGALARLVPIFKAFAGGKLGNGRQMVPWIHLDDVVGALLFAASTPALLGPMNVVAPNAVSNAEFAKALGRALDRPSWLPAPAFALRALFGEGAEPILSGQHAVPSVLKAHGFPFQFADLGAALKDLLDGLQP